VIDSPATINELTHLNPSLRIASVARAGRDVQDNSSKSHRIIVTYGGLIAKAADPIHIDSFEQRPPRCLALVGRLGKASIEVIFKRAVNKTGALIGSGNAG